jgi:SAM-dependent methyltransferase
MGKAPLAQPPDHEEPGRGAGTVTDFPDEWYALASAEHFWLQWRLRAALRQIRAVGLDLRAPLRVLDVGGGTGVLREQLESRTDWQIDITDLHPTAFAQARRGRGRNLRYDVTEHRPNMLGVYDVVLLFDVLEHVDRPVRFLESLARHLKRGGHLLVNVPALRVLCSGYDVAAGHLRRYERASLAAEVQPAGFEVLDTRYWGLSLVPLLLLRKLVLGRRSGPEVIRAGFRPPGAWVNAVLLALMRAEIAVVSRPFLGTSVLLAARKPG